MKSKFPSKFKTSVEQTKAIREEGTSSVLAHPVKVNYVPTKHVAGSADDAVSIAAQVFEASNKPDLEAIGRAARAQADDDAQRMKQFIHDKHSQGAGVAKGMPPYPSFLSSYPLPRMDTLYREPKWFTVGEAAKHIKLSPVKFIKLRTEGMKFYKLSDGTILYNVHDLNDWVMQHHAPAEVKS